MEPKQKFKKVEFNITGFGKFGTILKNPTTEIVENIEKYVENNPLHDKAVITDARVLVVAAEDVKIALDEIYTNAKKKQTEKPHIRQVVLHFGVWDGSPCFNIERTAYNTANFSIPDERGWVAKNEKIDEECKVDCLKNCLVDVEKLHECMKVHPVPVKVNDDPGRYICNYIYFLSLQESAKTGIPCLFVHCPNFKTVEKDDQMKFVHNLINNLTISLSSISK